MSLPPGLSSLDAAALTWFVICWVGYALVVDHTKLKRRSVAAVMSEYRVHWMIAMMQRDLRIIDTSIIGGILQGVAFFASTAILLIGGLIASLGASDEAIRVLTHLPGAAPASVQSCEYKVLLMIAIFIYAFFKLAWSFRLFVNCSILVGAAPLPPSPAEVVERYAASAARALSLASLHYNAGLRAFFFALAALWWFLNPLAMLVATSIVILVMYRREFHSRTLSTIVSSLELTASATAVERHRNDS
ncbi:MAG: DUF599 family protein [Pseudomonadota bacterium]